MAVSPIRLRSKSQVYRLTGAAPSAPTVIAKRCALPTAALEYAIYERILSILPISSLRCLGAVREDDGRFGWLFLEDAGDRSYDFHFDPLGPLASAWLAQLHGGAATLDTGSWLPHRGPDFHHRHLRLACRNMTDALKKGGLNARQRKILSAVLLHCERIDASWNALTSCCAGAPSTLVHGDFGPQNLRLHGGNESASLLVMDWEMAGWGSPAVDLALCPNLDLYRETIRTFWTTIDEQAILRLAWLGRIFRTVDCIYWLSCTLDCGELYHPPTLTRMFEELAAYGEIIPSYVQELHDLTQMEHGRPQTSTDGLRMLR